MSDSTAIRIRWVIAGIFLAMCVAADGEAQGMKDFGNRLEGTNIHRNALEDFTLLAIHRNFEPFPRNANLNVRFFLPKLPGNPNGSVFVQAVELQDSFHYFMQSKSRTWKDGGWNIFGPWPTMDVIDPLSLQSDNVGVLAGYRIGNNPPLYLPVDVYQKEGSLTKRTYTFHFVTGQDLQSLDISVTNTAGKEMSLQKPRLMCNKSFNANCRLYAAGSTQGFDLDMSSLPQGEYHLKLVGHVPGTSTLTSLEIVLYQHP